MIAAFLAIVPGGIVLSLSLRRGEFYSSFLFPNSSLYSPRCRANNNDTSHRFRCRESPYDCFVSDGVHRHSPVWQSGVAAAPPLLTSNWQRPPRFGVFPHRALSACNRRTALLAHPHLDIIRIRLWGRGNQRPTLQPRRVRSHCLAQQRGGMADYSLRLVPICLFPYWGSEPRSIFPLQSSVANSTSLRLSKTAPLFTRQFYEKWYKPHF